MASELTKRGYSDEEIVSIYELGRLYLENGALRQAETVFQGLNEVAPDFMPAWLGAAALQLQQNNPEAGLQAAQQAVRLDSDSCEAMLFLVTGLLATGDYQSAGTYLGEIRDRIDSGAAENPSVVRLFKAHLARYENR